MTCSRFVLIMGCAASAGFGSACQDTQSAAPRQVSAETSASNDLQPGPHQQHLRMQPILRQFEKLPPI